jgi:uncharacterized protein
MYQHNDITKRILYFPLTKMLIGLAVCLSIGIAGLQLTRKILDNFLLNEETKDLIGNCLLAFLVAISYKILYRYYEKRRITELSSQNFLKIFTLGLFIGAILQSLVFYVMYLNKSFTMVSINGVLPELPHLFSVLANAITAEIILIGIIFRITEEKLGSYFSLLLFSLLFGVIHFLNPNGSLLEAISIAMHGGFLLGAVYIYSRNLWLPITIHFAWDYTQASIFGATVSGYTLDKTVLSSKISGPSSLTGGYFGPHASLQAGCFSLLTALLFMILNHKQDKLIRPYWVAATASKKRP